MTKKTQEIDRVLGDRISSYRIAKKISRKHLADAVGITHQQIHKYEKGINRISVSRLYEICDYLLVDPITMLDISKNKEENIPDLKNKDIIKEILIYVSSIDDEEKLKAVRNLVKSI